jgi:copper chaperone
MELEIKVDGMTCDHCVQAVTGAVRESGGDALDVAVDLDAGVVTVSGDGLDRVALVSAIAEAGYEPVA